MAVLGDRLGIFQSKTFRGKTEEEIDEQFNKFNKEHKNIEYVSFTVDRDLIGEKHWSANMAQPYSAKMFDYGQAVGNYIYFEYQDDCVVKGGGLG